MQRTPARTFMDLVVWQKAHELALASYRATAAYPPGERFGLVFQMRKAAVSVPSNIAEGFRRRTRPDKARHLNIAQGSLEEQRYYLILSDALGYLPRETLMPLLEEVSRLLDSYTNSVAGNA